MNPVPAEVREFLATLKGDPVRPTAAKPLRGAEKLPRCSDCRKERELITYGLVRVCRECAADRDRKHGLTVQGREWA